MQQKLYKLSTRRRIFRHLPNKKTGGGIGTNRLLLTFFFIGYGMCIMPFVHAQDNPEKEKQHKIGFISGYGSQDLINVNYQYEVTFLQGQYYYRFLKKKTWSLELLLQPQYNITRYRPINHIARVLDGYEAGLNIGIVIKKSILKERAGIYALLSLGPHYTSGTPERQVSGFLFSDNLLFGLEIKITDRLYLDIRSGFRHISNADLDAPNGGINTTILSGGFSYVIPSQ